MNKEWYKPIECFEMYFEPDESIDVCDLKPVRDLEEKYQEAIEALHDATIEIMNTDYEEVTAKQIRNPKGVVLRNNQDKIGIIEKAYGKKWEDI